jgi:hypothetical protein
MPIFPAVSLRLEKAECNVPVAQGNPEGFEGRMGIHGTIGAGTIRAIKEDCCRRDSPTRMNGWEQYRKKEITMKTLKTIAILTLAAVGLAAAQASTPTGGKKEHKTHKTHKHHHHHKKGHDAAQAK